jgi:hypothetical protein
LSIFHIAYGLRLASNIPLPGFGICKEGGPVDLQVRLKERKKFTSKFSPSLSDVLYTSPRSNADSESNLRVDALDNGRYFGFFFSDGARFAIENQGREIWGDWPENYAFEDACTYLVGPVMAFALRLRGVTCLHASAIVVEGQAIVLMGVAGAGKSTTAAAFALSGFSVLSDDVAVLDDRNGRFLVQPGYPRINLWPDSVRTLFGSEDFLPRITPSWPKRYLALNENGYQFHSRPLPLRAIYILGARDDASAVPVVEKLTGSEAFATLVANTSVNYLLDADMRAREFHVLSRILSNVPARRVRPTANASKIFTLCETIVADTRQLAVQKSASASPEGD